MSLAVVGLIGSSSFAAPGSPTIARAETKDFDGDGSIDAILVTFSLPMDGSAAPNGFTVDGYAVTGTQWVSAGQGAPPTQLRVNFVEHATPDTDAKPGVKYRPGSPPAQSAPPLSTPLEATDIGSSDTAGPVLLKVYARDFGTPNTFIDALDEMRFEFSEKVKVGASVQSPSATDRLQALDTALKFQSIGNACPTRPNEDANPTDPNNGDDTNFPRLVSQTSADPIIEPARGAVSKVVKVRMGTPDVHLSSTITNVAVSGLCGVGVDPAAGTNIVDEATVPNNAVSMDFPAAGVGLRDITIAPVGVFFNNGEYQIGTRDLSPAVPDGIIDGVQITFESNLVDSSINSDVLKSRFTVKNGTETATVTGVETGSPDDASLLVRIAGDWGGGVKPNVSFDGSGHTLKAKVPTPGAQADVDSFGGQAGLPSIDQVGPAVSSAGAFDTDLNGLIDQIKLDMTETVATGASTNGWTVGGQPVNALNGAGSALLTLSFTESPSLGTGGTPAVAYDAAAPGSNTTDVSGAELLSQSFNALDRAAPRLMKATTLASVANGKTDRVTFELSEPVNTAGLAPSSFSIDGTPATGFGTSSIDPSGAPNDALITVVVDKAGTGRFGVGFTAPLTDGAGNLNADGATLPAAEVFDLAAPVVTSLTTAPASPFGTGTVTVNATFSEAVDSSIAPTANAGSKSVTPLSDLSHTNGFLNDDTSQWSGTVDFVSEDCAAQNGCAFSVTLTGAKDLSANDAIAATPISVVADTVAPDAPTGVSAVALQEAGAPAIDANKIGSRTKNLRIAASFTAGQVNTTGSTAGGIAEVLIDDEALSPAVRATGLGASASGITIDTAFANPAALQAAIPEGEHTLNIRLTDAAGNSVTSAGVPVVADYSPVSVTLLAPLGSAEPFTGGDHVCVQWDGNETANGLQNVALKYSIDGGTTYPHTIATNVNIDAIGDCAGVGNAYDWTVPGLNTTGLRLQIATIDSFANESKSASTSSMTVETITQTVTSIAASPSGLVYGPNATISGVVSGNGSPVAGKPVTIQRKIAGQSAFSTIATVTTGGNGAFSYTHKPTYNAYYKAVFARSGPYLASESAVRGITVAVSLPSRVNGTSFRRGQTFTVTGSVAPGKPGKKVWLQAYISGRWTTVAQQVLGWSSTYSLSHRSTGAKTWLFRVAYPTQDSLNAWNISTRYMVTWR